ncbi:MAG: S-layer homology domain-containing protein, partial [Cyanobacteria bacterium]|nr:S-layer homology domain-containing protein [Cyanobacteriota bacterium]MDW8200561.1 S-layer homology domain-containing protein [Cyanobacteriota bacterium SKYGB_h_bin112]
QANVIMGNGDHGILVTHQAKGEVRGNQFRNNGFGIAIQNDAAPLLADNQVQQNRWGIFISHQAKPVLRGNVVQQNREGGLAIINTALPDLGRMGDPGGNSIQNNQGSSDVTNATERRLVAVGNQLNPSRLQGEVVLSAEAPQPPATIPAPAPVPSPPTPTPPAITSQFQDIAAHWAEAFIRALIERRVLRGFPNGTFQPEAPMTRAEFAATIVTAFPIPDKRQPGQYTDVPSNFWAAQVIRKADSTGFMSGFPDGSFRPHLNLTRVQAMVAVVQGLGLRGGGPSDLGNYRDRAQIPSYAVDAIATATQRRLVVNYPLLDHLHPMRNITRAEVAALIYQGLVAIGAAPAIASPFIVNPMPVMTNFTDVQGHWAAAFIAGLAGQRMIGGFPDGSFRPDGMMTRVQYCGLLVNAFNPAPKREAVSFTDVPANFWGAAVIQRAYRGGFISGFTHGMFRPHDAIARVQVLVSLVQGLGLPPADLALLHRYLDQDKIPAYARNAVASATANHLVLNYPVQQWLNPNLAATRGEVTAMVYQALVRARRVPAIASPFIITV